MTTDLDQRNEQSDPEDEEQDSDHEKSDEEELVVARKLENQLNMMAEDADLLEDLKKLKRSTKNVSISAQNSLAVVTLLGEADDEDGTSAGFTSKHVDVEAERAAKSIGGAITNSKMQSYYKAFSNK